MRPPIIDTLTLHCAIAIMMICSLFHLFRSFNTRNSLKRRRKTILKLIILKVYKYVQNTMMKSKLFQLSTKYKYGRTWGWGKWYKIHIKCVKRKTKLRRCGIKMNEQIVNKEKKGKWKIMQLKEQKRENVESVQREMRVTFSATIFSTHSIVKRICTTQFRTSNISWKLFVRRFAF